MKGAIVPAIVWLILAGWLTAAVLPMDNPRLNAVVGIFLAGLAVGVAAWSLWLCWRTLRSKGGEEQC